MEPERGKGARRAGEAAFPPDWPVTDSLGQSGQLDQPSQEVTAVAAVTTSFAV